MTGADLAVVRPAEHQLVTLSNDQLTYISRTDFVPEAIRGNLPAILACVATGRSLGIPDMTALREIHMIDGKPGLSAALCCALVRARGHSITGEVSDRAATVVGVRGDNGDTMTYTFTWEMAERVQVYVKGGGKKPLASKDTWQNYPEAMLWARAVTQLCRMLFSDVFLGGVYAVSELEDHVEPEQDSAGADSLEAHDPAPAPAGDDVPFLEPGEQVETPKPMEWKDDDQKRRYLTRLTILVKTHLKPEELRRVYATVARMRVRSTDALILEVGGMGEDAELHWTPLRDSLTRAEAHDLIDRLEKLESQA